MSTDLTLLECVDLIEETKENSKNALTEKGVQLDDSYGLSQVDEKIEEIQAGGSGGYVKIDSNKFVDTWSSYKKQISNERFNKITFCYDKAPAGIETVDISKNKDGSIVMWFLSENEEIIVSTQTENVIILIPNNVGSQGEAIQYYPYFSIFTKTYYTDPEYSLEYWSFQEIDFSNCQWDWENQTDFRGTFANASGNIIGINDMVEKIEFYKVISADQMFKNVSDWDKLELPSMNNCISADEMFRGSSIADISIESMTSLENAQSMFYGSAVKKLNIGALDNCKNFKWFLWGCNWITNDINLGYQNKRIEPLSLEHFMGYIQPNSYVENPMTEIDLSNFVVSEFTNLSGAFSGSTNLQTIYADNWSDKIIALDQQVFNNNNSLKGAVSYSRSKLRADMCNYNTGYFTDPKTKP